MNTTRRVDVKRHPWPVRYARYEGLPDWCGNERKYGKGSLRIPANGRVGAARHAAAGQAIPAAVLRTGAARWRAAIRALYSSIHTAAANAHDAHRVPRTAQARRERPVRPANHASAERAAPHAINACCGEESSP